MCERRDKGDERREEEREGERKERRERVESPKHHLLIHLIYTKSKNEYIQAP